VSAVFSAPPEALVEVDGLGAEKARQIREALEAVYKDGR